MPLGPRGQGRDADGDNLGLCIVVSLSIDTVKVAVAFHRYVSIDLRWGGEIMGQMIKSSMTKMAVFMFAMLMILANDSIVESGTTRMKTPPDKAMLYVYRVYKGCQGEIDFDLTINGNYSFAIPNGTFLALLLEPGKYEIVMPPNNQKNVHVDQKVILNANAGKTEYIMTAATCRSTDPNVLSKVDNTSGRYDLERLKPADPDAEIVHLNSLGHQANSNTSAKALSVPTTVSNTATQSGIDEVPAAKAKEQKRTMQS